MKLLSIRALAIAFGALVATAGMIEGCGADDDVSYKFYDGGKEPPGPAPEPKPEPTPDDAGDASADASDAADSG